MTDFDRRLSIIWALLVVATLVSWGSSGGPRSGIDWVAAMVIGIAFLKARFVGLEFMELRHAPALMRIAFEAWVAILGLALIVLHAASAWLR